jgi:hypothetical protein
MPFAAAMPHGPIEEVFPDVFMVKSGYKAGVGVMFERNMTVWRRAGGELVVFNSARLTEDGERELDKLGKVAHVVRLAAFHGLDDPYYVDRYKAALWGAAGMKHDGKAISATDHPLGDADVFHFAAGNHAELCAILPMAGGVLVAGDSYQNWTTTKHCSLLVRAMMPFMGFGPACIGGPWLKKMGNGVKVDFERLAKMDWKHLIPAHGTVLNDSARDQLGSAIAKRFSTAT